jgi:CMP-N,N'-diacetyllegionaminic acid synthase
MRILALITARGGSKRLPGKNIRVLGGKPLIVWSIDVARGIPEICDILVSTDDPTIAAVCSEAGAFVPWLRPEWLATDTAGSVDVALHALDWYEAEKGAVDGLLLLQPTSPFRTKETVRKGIELFRENVQHSVLGVSSTHAHPMWTFKLEGDYLVPFIEGRFDVRSQDLPAAYVVNGSFYLTTPAALRMKRSFVGNQTIPLIIHSNEEALDIDTEWDWSIALSIGNNFWGKNMQKNIKIKDHK